MRTDAARARVLERVVKVVFFITSTLYDAFSRLSSTFFRGSILTAPMGRCAKKNFGGL